MIWLVEGVDPPRAVEADDVDTAIKIARERGYFPGKDLVSLKPLREKDWLDIVYDWCEDEIGKVGKERKHQIIVHQRVNPMARKGVI